MSQIRMRPALQAQGVSDDVLPFKASGWPYIPWAGFAGCVFFVFFQVWTAFAPWDVQSFFMNYIIIIVFLILAISWKFGRKSNWVHPKRADLTTGRRDGSVEVPGAV